MHTTALLVLLSPPLVHGLVSSSSHRPWVSPLRSQRALWAIQRRPRVVGRRPPLLKASEESDAEAAPRAAAPLLHTVPALREKLRALGNLVEEPANTKKLVALDRANFLELGKYGFVFGLTMWRFSLGRAQLGAYDTKGNSAKMLSLISTICAQFLTVGGLYATVLSSQLRWASGVWETARNTKRKTAFRRLKRELTDPARPINASQAVPLSAHLRAFLSDEEYRNEQESKKAFNEKVKATVTTVTVVRLLCALFFVSFVQLTAVACKSYA